MTQGEGGTNLYFDIVMLPMNEFQRMRTNVGLQHMVAPQPKMGPTFNPGFVLSDVKQISVPDSEPNPAAYAKSHFLKLFGISDMQKDVQVAPPENLPDDLTEIERAFKHMIKNLGKTSS